MDSSKGCPQNIKGECILDIYGGIFELNTYPKSCKKLYLTIGKNDDIRTNMFNDIKKLKRVVKYPVEINDKIKASGDAAAQDVKLRQKAEYVKNGGIAGSAGRLFAHYAGAVTHPKQTIMQGRDYHTPMSNLDIDRIAEANTESKEIAGKKALNNEDNIKNEDKKNNLPDDPKIGERQIE